MDIIQAINGGFQGSVIEMVVHSGPVAKAVLLLLLLFSIISWSIMFQKMLLFRKANKESRKFRKVFPRGGSLNNAYASSKILKNSHVANIFISGYLDVVSLQKYRRKENSLFDETRQSQIQDDLQALQRALDKAESKEISRFEKGLSFLATTGSTSPFIGLFGTVWGIMDAFRAIGIKGSASIGGVAPGISEALIATAAGLAAAIPAVIGYNHFNNKINFIASEMDEFSLEFVSVVERNLMRKK
tara:strand:+ start:9549 stop:10280 length:732 start_codon:yes stop_codon:yes gene_type:complete